MFARPYHLQHDPQHLIEVIQRYSFATVLGGSPVQVSHIPLLYKDGTLVGHIDRANPLCVAIEAGEELLAIFHGPHVYVSASWYVDARTVPTWNYLVVHARGKARQLADASSLYESMRDLVAHFEAGQADPYPIGRNMPEGKLEGLMHGILGFEIVIEKLEGIFKLSQDKSPADRASVITELEHNTHDSNSLEVGEYMRKQNSWEER